MEIERSSAFADTAHVERIEAQILVRELLDGLSSSDREIFTRSMNGETGPEIDVAMDLKPRTAEIRLAVCKNTLRRAVQKELKPLSRRVPADPIGEDNPIEAILLIAFPNPERVGCPSPEVIKAMSNQQIGRDDPAWNHIWNCSPCFSDFKVLRDVRVRRVQREFERRRTRRTVLRAAAAVVVSSGIAYYSAVAFRSRSHHQVTAIQVDLTNAGATRGPTTVVETLPRKVDEIQLILPPSSPGGRYMVAVLASQSEDSAVALGAANTETKNGQSIVVVTLDLSEAPPGQFFVGTRREVNGHQGTPSYYPVAISD